MEIGMEYIRKSTFLRKESVEEAVAYQKSEIKKYASEKDIVIAASFTDIGFSGKDANRPELQQMLEFVKQTDIDVLLFYSVDRLGRDLEHNVDIVLEILKYVKRIVFVDTEKSSDSELWKDLFLLHTASAEKERSLLLDRVTKGRREKILDRKSYNGQTVPLGYVKGKNKDEERLFLATKENTDDDSEHIGLLIVQFIFLAYLFGMTYRGIAKALNERFDYTKRKKTWHDKSVRYILQNPIYSAILKGELEGKSYFESGGNVEPLIDPSLFQLIHYKMSLEKAGRRANGERKHTLLPIVCKECLKPVRDDGEEYVCDSCGLRIGTAVLKEKVKTSVFQYLHSSAKNQNIPEFLFEKKKVIDRKLRQLKRKLKDLLRREEQIQSMFEKNTESVDINTFDQMFLINNSEQTKLKREIEYYQALQNFLFDGGSVNVHWAMHLCTYAFSLPFLIFVEGGNKEIFLLFHKSIFLEGALSS